MPYNEPVYAKLCPAERRGIFISVHGDPERAAIRVSRWAHWCSFPPKPGPTLKSDCRIEVVEPAGNGDPSPCPFHLPTVQGQ